MFAGCGLQGAERTDRVVAGSLGGADGLDQEMVGVGFAADGFARSLKEHFVPNYISKSKRWQGKCAILYTLPAGIRLWVMR